MSENEKTRVSLNFDNEVISRVKDFAKKNGINDTSAYMVLLNYGLKVADTLDNDIFKAISLHNDIKHIILDNNGENDINLDK